MRRKKKHCQSVGKKLVRLQAKTACKIRTLFCSLFLTKPLSMLWCDGWFDVDDASISGPRLSTGIAVLNRFNGAPTIHLPLVVHTRAACCSKGWKVKGKKPGKGRGKSLKKNEHVKTRSKQILKTWQTRCSSSNMYTSSDWSRTIHQRSPVGINPTVIT